MISIGTILVVGYGSMGRRRIRLSKYLIPHVKYVCVDSNLERQEQARRDGYIAVTSVEKGIELSPDIAFVCTSPGNHADIILRLLNAGIHVFTELNLTSDKYDYLIKASAKNNKILFISSTLVYKRQMEEFNRVVSQQTKPLAYSYHVGQYLPDWHPWESYKDYFICKKETNGIREIMAIQLPWIIKTFGEIRSIGVMSQHCTDLDISFPDSVLLSIEHRNGNIGSFIVDLVARKAVTRLEIIGEDLHLFWNGHNDDLYILDIEAKELKQVMLYESEEHLDGYSDVVSEEPYKEEIIEFLSAINGGDVRYDLDDDAYVLSVIDIIEAQYGSNDSSRVLIDKKQ